MKKFPAALFILLLMNICIGIKNGFDWLVSLTISVTAFAIIFSMISNQKEK